MASTPPLIFKRSVKSKPLRTRQTSPENDSDRISATPEVEMAEDSPSTLAIKLKNKAKKSRTKSKLSFGGDEEEGDGEVFQVKKSNLSKKLSLGKHAASVPLNLDQATISPSRGPTYDQAYLNQLKASTPTARPSAGSTGEDAYDADMSMDVDAGVDSIRTVDIFDDESTASTPAYIPSESSIKVAKEKRDRLRKTQASGEEDFISLSLTKREEDAGPHPESRLMREDDELGEGDDEFAEFTSAQDRIALGKKSRKREAAKKRETMKEMIEDADEEDEETKEWEQEQLRRGGHLTPEPSTPSKVKQVYRPAPIPSVTTIPTLPPVLARLSQQLAQLTASHAKNTAALNSLAQERQEVEDREKEMREMVVKAEDKRAWFGDFREWIESVAGFLDEKYPLLEKLEEEHISLLRERLDLITQRRRLDDEDDLTAVYGPLSAPPVTEPESEETDELGRVIPKPTPAALRRERRAARITRHQQCLQQQKRAARKEEEEGYSTDSSLPALDASDYASAMLSLGERTKAILADVRAEEFRNPTGARWNAWREKYGDTYRNAWGGLGVISVWEFWVRLEVVGWDCIADSRSLDSFRWYKGLYSYSRPGSGDDGEESELGPDGDLVASMITTAVIPRLCRLVESGALDVYSERHVRRMVDLAEEVEASIEEGNIKFQTLLGSVVSTFEAAIADTEALLERFEAIKSSFPPFNPEAIPSRRRFLVRRLKLLKNLLLWRKYMGERFSIDRLVTRLVENCFMGVAEGGWDVGGKDVAETMVALLPPELVSTRLKQRLQV